MKTFVDKLFLGVMLVCVILLVMVGVQSMIDTNDSSLLSRSLDYWEDEGYVAYADPQGNLTVTGDLTAKTGRSVTYFIAAENAPAHVRNQADYVVEDTADDEIQAVIDLVYANGGGSIKLSEGIFPIEGTYSDGEIITLYADIHFTGSGWSTIIRVADNTTDIDEGINVIGCSYPASNVTISNLCVDGNRANNYTPTSSQDGHNINLGGTDIQVLNVKSINSTGDGLEIGGYNILVDGCVFSNNFEHNLHLTTSSEAVITNNYFSLEYTGEGSLHCGNTPSVSTSNVIISHNTFTDDVGRAIDFNVADSSGIMINDNIINSSGNSSIRVTGTGAITDISINDNIIIDATNEAITVYPASGHTLSNLNINGNTINSSSMYGISTLRTNVVNINNNIITYCGTSGLNLGSGDLKDVNVSGNILINNGQAGSNTHTAIRCRPGTATGFNRVFIKNNSIVSDVAVVNKYGIHFESNTGNYTDTYVNNNFIYGMGTAALQFDEDITFTAENIGYTTENSGNATINNGANSTIITHSLNITPDVNKINIIGLENPTNDVGTIWITSANATNFTVNVECDPGASNWDFGWNYRN